VEILSDLSGGNSTINSLTFSGAGGGDGLCFRAIYNNAASESKTISSSGSLLTEVMSMRCIHIASELERVKNKRERWKSGWGFR
jgi:hypothetical protein